MSGNAKNREQIRKTHIENAIQEIRSELYRRLDEEKGYGTYASRHEILGIATEEYHELVEAVEQETLAEVKHEAIDLAVMGIFGIACINQSTLDW